MKKDDKKPFVLMMEGIVKRFPGVIALDRVDFTLYPGEVHVLLGENGAGKSTLMKILSGAYTKDEGKIFISNQEVEIGDPRTAQDLGIAIIYQEFSLIPHLTVAENIFIGREPRKKNGLIDWEVMKKSTQEILKELDADFGALTLVKELSVANQQLTEIAKAISTNAQIIIMDEPTATLTPHEIDKLFSIIRRLKDLNKSIIFISHHLEEAKEIGDRATILRDGKRVATVNVNESTIDDFIKMMVGRTLDEQFPKIYIDHGGEYLRVEGLSRDGFLEDISFSLYEGEVLGVAGLVGAGRTEMCRCIFGADPKTRGRIYVLGEEVIINTPKDAIKAGIGFLTENRKEEGLVLYMNIRENITLPILNSLAKSPLKIIDKNKQIEISNEYFNRLNIKAPSLERPVNELSGGNQQKVVLAKWLATNSKILIFDEPTRGIDVGAKVEIYELMNELIKQGVAILMVSSEMPEIIGMSDRIMVMCNGRITGLIDDRSCFDQELIMRYATAYRKKEVA